MERHRSAESTLAQWSNIALQSTSCPNGATATCRVKAVPMEQHYHADLTVPLWGRSTQKRQGRPNGATSPYRVNHEPMQRHHPTESRPPQLSKIALQCKNINLQSQCWPNGATSPCRVKTALNGTTALCRINATLMEQHRHAQIEQYCPAGSRLAQWSNITMLSQDTLMEQDKHPAEAMPAQWSNITLQSQLRANGVNRAPMEQYIPSRSTMPKCSNTMHSQSRPNAATSQSQKKIGGWSWSLIKRELRPPGSV